MHFYPFIQADLTKGVLFTFVPYGHLDLAFQVGLHDRVRWLVALFQPAHISLSLSFTVRYHISSPNSSIEFAESSPQYSECSAGCSVNCSGCSIKVSKGVVKVFYCSSVFHCRGGLQ